MARYCRNVNSFLDTLDCYARDEVYPTTHTMTTWTPNPEYYDFGRPFPAEKVIQLVTKTRTWADKVPGDVKKRIFEPGAGTGRILLPLAQSNPHAIFFGADSYDDALAVCNRRAREAGVKNIRLATIDLAELDSMQMFDAIIHSSVFHAIVEWKSIIKKLISILSPRGVFVLIGDSGDVHTEALGRSSPLGVDHKLCEFWAAYRELRRSMNLEDPEASQRGCKWNIESDEIAEHLGEHGFAELERNTLTWEENYRVEDLLKIVDERCYSSMFTLDETICVRLAADLRERFSVELDVRVVSRHTAVARFFATT